MQTFATKYYDSAVNVPGLDPTPNAQAPAAARIFSVPRDEDRSYAAEVFVIDGTSIVLTLWVNDSLSGVWLPITGANVVPSGAPLVVPVPPGAQLFLQYGAIVGGVTKLAVGFVSSGAVNAQASTAATGPLPAGASTSALQSSVQAASGGAISANAETVGGIGKDAAPGAVADGTTVRSWWARTGQAFNTIVDKAGAAFLSVATVGAAHVATGLQLLASDGANAQRVLSGLSGVQASLVGMLNQIAMLQYNVAAPVAADGNVVPAQGDAGGNLKVREQYAAAAEDNGNGVIATAMKFLANASYAQKLFWNDPAKGVATNVRNTACVLLGVSLRNQNAAIRYLQFHNLNASPPAGAAVPVFSIPVPGGASATFLEYGAAIFGLNGILFTTGLTIATSTTEGTYTAAAAGDIVSIIATGP